MSRSKESKDKPKKLGNLWHADRALRSSTVSFMKRLCDPYNLLGKINNIKIDGLKSVYRRIFGELLKDPNLGIRLYAWTAVSKLLDTAHISREEPECLL